jgi:hypothetical protein
MNAEDLFLKKFGNKMSAMESWVIRFAEDYAKIKLEEQKELAQSSVIDSAVSRDYKLLFDKISTGLIVPCFVDYDWRDGTPPFRDVAKAVRVKEKSIMVGARGIQYGGVEEYKLRGRTELEAFTDECMRMNLEYQI